MGCIPSKAVARSISLRENPNPGIHGASVTWEELLASHSGKEKLFSFVGVSAKLRSSSFTLPSGEPGKERNLIPEVNGKTEVESGPVDDRKPSFGRFTRSRSCQVIRDGDDPGTDGIAENKIGWKDKTLAGSRSFHTVEEYDALLERIHKFSTISESIQRNTEDLLGKEQEGGSKQDMHLDQDGSKNYESSEKVAEVDGSGETGWKRKSVAKGLKSLDVEFPGIARFRQRHRVEGHIYSPGTYVTPKFGSYNAKATRAAKGNDVPEDSVFSPELVAAFEDCMHQLQEEEDSILSHMDEYLEVDDIMENQVNN